MTSKRTKETKRMRGERGGRKQARHSQDVADSAVYAGILSGGPGTLPDDALTRTWSVCQGSLSGDAQWKDWVEPLL